MRSPKSSHTGGPLAVVLISYPGKDTHLPKIPGNLKGTYNMPKLYSRSTNSDETYKTGQSCVVRTGVFSSRLHPCSLQDCVVQTSVFSSRPSCVTICRLRPTPLLLVQALSIVNDSTVSFLLPSLANSATFFTPLSSNNPPLSRSWKDNHRMKTMRPFRALSASFTTCL